MSAVVIEHRIAHVLSHALEHLVALFDAELPGVRKAAEKYLEIDFVIGEVDARGVVNRVGINAPAAARELDTSVLRKAEVPAFADDFHPKLGRVDAHAVVRAVVYVGGRFEIRL